MVERTIFISLIHKQTGFVINSNAYLVLTENGGEDWKIIHENEGTFFRCIIFKNRQEGWLGTIGTDDPYLRSRDSISLFETKDGGQNWSPVKFIGSQPKGLCGLQIVNDNFYCRMWSSAWLIFFYQKPKRCTLTILS